MVFEDRAREAGRHANQVGKRAQRPDLGAVARRKRQRRSTGLAVIVVASLSVLFVVSPFDPDDQLATTETTTTTVQPTTTTTLGACVVTIPDGSFVPPPEFPLMPPELFDSAWFGSEGLWTMVPLEGARWDGLPQNSPGLYTQKVFWWTEGFLAMQDPVPQLEVTATNMRTGDRLVFAGRDITSGFQPDIGNFMISGVDLPAGCWELTGVLEESMTRFVVEVVGA